MGDIAQLRVKAHTRLLQQRESTLTQTRPNRRELPRLFPSQLIMKLPVYKVFADAVRADTSSAVVFILLSGNRFRQFCTSAVAADITARRPASCCIAATSFISAARRTPC